MKKITLTELLDYIYELPIKEKEELWEWIYNHTLVGGEITQTQDDINNQVSV